MAPSKVHILRIPRAKDGDGAAGDGEGPVLVYVSSAGSKQLDLKLDATEGESVYELKLRHKSTSELKVPNSPISQDEWDAILASVLLGDGAPVDDIEAVASVNAGSSISLTLRKRIQGFTQRLGTLRLVEASTEISLFDWCDAAVASRDGLAAGLAETRARAAELEAAVAARDAELAELKAAKRTVEDEWLGFFCALLNEKKVRNRQLQKVLATAAAGADPAKLRALEEAQQQQRKGRAAGPSRRGKRKAAQASALSDDDEEEEEFEAMDVDRPAGRGEVDDDDAVKIEPDDRETTEDDEDDDATGSEDQADSDEEEEPIPAPPPPRRAARKAKEAIAETSTTQKGKGKGKGKEPAHEEDEDADEDGLPPRRELPFMRSAPKPAPKAAPPPAAGDSDTESDDEL